MDEGILLRDMTADEVKIILGEQVIKIKRLLDLANKLEREYSAISKDVAMKNSFIMQSNLVNEYEDFVHNGCKLPEKPVEPTPTEPVSTTEPPESERPDNVVDAAAELLSKKVVLPDCRVFPDPEGSADAMDRAHEMLGAAITRQS